jgi:hypothetical protein
MFGQLPLFDSGPVAARPLLAASRFESDPEPESSDWRGVLSHPQFEYGWCRAVFGNRGGWGPLLIMPDTNVLIDLVDAYDSVESHFGIGRALPRGDRDSPVDALRELFALWFHRDIRWVLSDLYLSDSRKKKLPAAVVASRQRVLDALSADMQDRGGLDRKIVWCEPEDDRRALLEGWCSDDDHARAVVEPFAIQAEAMLPGSDGLLVGAALRSGVHVFLTEDRGVLRKAGLLYAWGLSVLRPGQLLDALDDAGELGTGGIGGPGFELAPDLLSLSRFYAIAES